MTVPQLLPVTTPTIASFDFVDLASGTGYIIFKAGNANTTPDYILTDFDFYSEDITTITNSDGTAVLDLDFDIEFNLPRTIKGNLILSVPIGMVGHDQVATYGLQMDINGFIYHYDGTTETSLGTFQSDVLTIDAPAQNKKESKMMTFNIPIALKKFKKGEILRVNVKVDGTIITGAGDGFFGIAHDPKNRNDDADDTDTVNRRKIIDDDVDTIMEVQVPFRITQV